MTVFLQWQTASVPYTPYQENSTTTPCYRGGATNLKMTNPRSNPHHHFSTLRLARAEKISPPDYPSRLSRQPGAETRVPGKAHPGASHKRIRSADPRTSGSRGRRSLARMDVAIGAHTHLTVCTQVLNSSHHRLTRQQDQEYMPKHHDDSVMG
jgi:hypothetical protein